MHWVHGYLLQIHIGIGAMALLAFWLPVASRKGSRFHRNAGWVFVITMSVVAATAITMSLMVLADPVGIRAPERNFDMARGLQVAREQRMFSLFLLMLGVLTATGLRHGLLALRTRTNPAALRSPLHLSQLVILGVLGIGVGIVGFNSSSILLMVFAAISMSASFNALRETRIARMTRNQRLRAHFGGLIGTGVGAYTAFFAFGGSRLLSDILSGQWQVIPWILPAVIGTIAIKRVERQYPEEAPA
ncbi:MAG: hypothetical protein AAF290_05010 [Pseudomonadota bacterium]